MLSKLIRRERKRRGLSCARIDQRAGLLPGTTQLIERHALRITAPDVLRRIADGLESEREVGRRALYVELLLAAGVITTTDIEAWAEPQARRAA